ncbi:MAG: hypothetical protein ACOH1R_03800 [Luteimonas sp.]
MIRKLHNTLLAASASGLMLVFGLMASSPALPGDMQDIDSPEMPLTFAGTDAATQASIDAAQAGANRIEAHVRQLQAGLDRNPSLGDTIAGAVSFAAAVSTDVALNAAFEASAQAAEKRAAETEQRRHARRVRSALAVPYFSFAQGLRRNSRS